MVKRIPTLLMAVLGFGCATVPTQKDEAFSFAVEAVQKRSYDDGAHAAWNFVDSADPDDPRYDRGLKLVANSAEQLGLQFAAGMIYRQIATERRNMEIVPDALKGLMRIVESEVYDEDMLVTSFIASLEFGELPPDVKAFVDFHQGLDLARRGDDDWSEVSFGKIPKDSPYHGRAEYVRAVRHVAEGDYRSAIRKLETLRKKKTLDERTRTDVRRTLARIAFEERRYNDALTHFNALKELAPDDPEILLEAAWTHFYLGDSRKTLGLIIALDAPVHSRHISPERYLLEALALRRLCQFGAAREAAARLETKYGASLEKLSAGQLPQQIPELRDAARYRGMSRLNSLFLESLEKENRTLQSLKERLGTSLYTYLDDLYRRGIAEAKMRREARIGEDLNTLAEELLSSREGVRLIIHELGVSLLRGRRRPAGATEKPAFEVPITGDKVFYNFDGEYWTDELDDLIVIAEDRCID